MKIFKQKKDSSLHGNPNVNPDQRGCSIPKDVYMLALKHECGHLWFLWLSLKEKFGVSKAKEVYEKIDPFIALGYKERLKGEPRSVGADGNWEYLSENYPSSLIKKIQLKMLIGGPAAEYYYCPEKWEGWDERVKKWTSGNPELATKDFPRLIYIYGWSPEECKKKLTEAINEIKSPVCQKFIGAVYSSVKDHPETWGHIEVWPIIKDKLI